MIRTNAARLLAAAAMLSLIAAAGPDTADSEVAKARQLAGNDFRSSLYLCDATSSAGPDALLAQRWYAPAKAFDDLWFIGSTFVGTWVLKTSDGLILFDALGSEADVKNHLEPGLRAIGLDPKDIRYVLVTHGHWDHYGGAKYLQERYGAHIGLTREDWDYLDRMPPTNLARAPYFGPDTADRPPPRRDLVITDGMKLKLGDGELTLFVSPGHTPGTLSALIPVHEGGRTYVLSLLGGTAFPRTLEPDEMTGGMNAFERSVTILAERARKAGAVGIINTHPHVDGSDHRIERALARRPGEPNPFILGADKVGRYYGMFHACLRAAMLRPRNPNAGPPMPSAAARKP
jgi:metallo-beta-lactamase class B